MKDNKSQIEVVLDIFSGRPNPTWELSDNQVDELRPKIRVSTSAKPKTPPGLGYRGVRLINIGKVANIPDRIIAYDGVLSVTEEGKTNYYEDINKIEEWLLDQAREQGYGEAIEKFRQYGRK